MLMMVVPHRAPDRLRGKVRGDLFSGHRQRSVGLSIELDSRTGKAVRGGCKQADGDGTGRQDHTMAAVIGLGSSSSTSSPCAGRVSGSDERNDVGPFWPVEVDLLGVVTRFLAAAAVVMKQLGSVDSQGSPVRKRIKKTPARKVGGVRRSGPRRMAARSKHVPQVVPTAVPLTQQQESPLRRQAEWVGASSQVDAGPRGGNATKEGRKKRWAERAVDDDEAAARDIVRATVKVRKRCPKET